MIRVYLLIFSLLLSSITYSQTKMTNDEIREFVYQVTYDGTLLKTLQSDFTQTKKSQLLKNEMVTSGRMSFQNPDLLNWRYTVPYEYSVLFKDKKIFINDRGKKSKSAIQNRMFDKISKLIVGSASGNLFTDPEFTVTYFKTSGTNIARFSPKAAQLKKYVKQIEIQFQKGKTTASKVIMYEASGDSTIIDFKNTKVNSPIPPTEFVIN